MSAHARHGVEKLLAILHESAAQKADLLAVEMRVARRETEGLRAFLRRMDRQLGEASVLCAAHALLARLQSERGGSDRVV